MRTRLASAVVGAAAALALTAGCTPPPDPPDSGEPSMTAVAGVVPYAPYKVLTPTSPSPALDMSVTVYSTSVAPIDDDSILFGNYNEIVRYEESTGTVQRIAGGGTYTDGEGTVAPGSALPGGFGGAAVDTFIAHPQQITAAPDGTIYFLSHNVGTFLVAVTPDGTITKIAGDGTGSSGDGGPAVDAGLDTDLGVSNLTLAPNGDLYFTHDGRVRRIDMQTATIDTVLVDPNVDLIDIDADGTLWSSGTLWDPDTGTASRYAQKTVGGSTTSISLSGPCTSLLYPMMLTGELPDGRKVILSDDGTQECTIDLVTGATTSRPVDVAWNQHMIVDHDLERISDVALGPDGRRWFVAHDGTPDVPLRPIRLFRWIAGS